MDKQVFYAKVLAVNVTTYQTKTVSALSDKNETITLSMTEEDNLKLNAIYLFEVTPFEFKDQIRYEINKATTIEESTDDLHKKQELMTFFYDFAPVDIDVVKEIIESKLEEIKNEVIKNITLHLYNNHKKEFYLYPAATKFHHAYIGGLSYHTSTMMKLVDGMKEVYPFLNKDLLIAGVLLHDICKVDELSNYAGPEYTKVGKLLGHITMGVKAIHNAAIELNVVDSEEETLLEHMILSHHYFGNYGSPKKPNIPEALILHFIDNIDSKMTVLMEELNLVEPGEFTPPIPVIDREKFYKSKL